MTLAFDHAYEPRLRIAFSGAHATGKTTLIAELRNLLPHFEFIGEPYYGLLDEGYVFADIPSAEDYEAQLERSIDVLTGSGGANVFFDRCPADYLAYLDHVRDGGGNAVTYWIDAASEALKACDLIVFVPIEHPDRINGFELPRLRRKVDFALREILLDDRWGLGINVLEASGSLSQRVSKVLAHLETPDGN